MLIAGDAVAEAAPPGQWRQVSIFLSPMNVHINRVPASGTVTRVSYTPGRFLPAYRHDAGTTNELSEIWIDHQGAMVVARQIVGIRFESDALPIAGEGVFDEKQNQVGGITSSTISPLLSNHAICLGLVKKQFTSPGSVVFVPAEGAMRKGTVVQLPFVEKDHA